jgi:DNA-binding NarL/FixJ family response regulator
MAISIIVADGQRLFVEGMRLILERENDIKCVATTTDGLEAIRLTEKLLPDAVLINVEMSGISGINATKRIKSSCPNTAVLIFADYQYDTYVVSSIQAGAGAYLLKSVEPDQVIQAIRMVIAGEGVFDLRAATKDIARVSKAEGSPLTEYDELHTREIEIVRLVASGLSNKEIGNRLHISTHTVSSHLANIFKKIGTSSRVEVALFALKKGLVKLHDLTE